jgi:alpha-tubulin suppressor-like RCC1 family protein
MQTKTLLLVALGVAMLFSWNAGPATGSGITEVATGRFHTCALTLRGEVLCWGLNDFGQVGGTATNDCPDPEHACNPMPLLVEGLGSDVTAIDAGFVHTCALTNAGGVKCWGSNSYGELGDGTTTDSSTPVDVVGLSGPVAALTAGGLHNCVSLVSGAVQCWGRNEAGQLGAPTSESCPAPVGALFPCSTTPVAVETLSNVVSVVAGSYSNCAISSTGGVKCWGNNEYGGLGDGTAGDGLEATLDNYSTLATSVVGLDSGVAAVTAGAWHTCALLAIGGAKCWGLNFQGQLGTGTTSPDPPYGASTPQDVVGFSGDVASVEAGGLFTCALTTGGGVKCWGLNLYGQLGDGTTETRATPTDVAGLTSGVAGIAPAAPGGFHACAIMAAGGIKCWGRHEHGEVGDGATQPTIVTTPQNVVGLSSAPADWDGDGCADKRELGLTAAVGGQRDPFSFWDFFDVPSGAFLARDHAVTAADIAGVVARFGSSDAGAGTFDRNSDPLSLPIPAGQPSGTRQNYHPAFDRGGSIPGQDQWSMLPPDGSISAGDLAGVVAQFGHTCV